MKFIAASKTLAVLTENATSSQTHSHVIDSRGFASMSADVCFERVAAAGTASAVATVLKLQESDDGTTYTDVTSFVGGGTGGFTIPTPANTTAEVIVRFDRDLRGAKRYQKIVATGQATGSIFSVARLGGGDEAPWDATSKGVDAAVAAFT